MPYKDRESRAKYMRDYREGRKPSENVNPSVNPVTPYRSLEPVIGEPGHLREWLQDPVMRHKLGAICLALKRHDQQNDVRLGVFGPTMGEVGNILDETSALDVA